MPIPKTPIQGDAARLEQIGVGLKQQGGTHGPLVQKNDVGRPSTGQAPSPGPRDTGVGEDVKGKYRAVAQAEWVTQFWTMMMQRFPGPATEYYAALAQNSAKQIAEGTYNSTPNFEF